jgi:hypothetical protein
LLAGALLDTGIHTDGTRVGICDSGVGGANSWQTIICDSWNTHTLACVESIGLEFTCVKNSRCTVRLLILTKIARYRTSRHPPRSGQADTILRA